MASPGSRPCKSLPMIKDVTGQAERKAPPAISLSTCYREADSPLTHRPMVSTNREARPPSQYYVPGVPQAQQPLVMRRPMARPHPELVAPPEWITFPLRERSPG